MLICFSFPPQCASLLKKSSTGHANKSYREFPKMFQTIIQLHTICTLLIEINNFTCTLPLSNYKPPKQQIKKQWPQTYDTLKGIHARLRSLCFTVIVMIDCTRITRKIVKPKKKNKNVRNEEASMCLVAFLYFKNSLLEH